MRIGVVSNTSWYLYNFRLGLMRALRSAGHDVLAIAPRDAYADKLESQGGIAHRAVDISGDGINPFREMGTVAGLAKLFYDEKLDLVLSNTPKGNIYSCVAGRFAGVPVIPNVSGLGRVFTSPSRIRPLVKWLYRISFAKSPKVLFQNRDDRGYFVDAGLVSMAQATVLAGSGVDLRRYSPEGRVQDGCGDGAITFLLIARMLWDKGVGEFVAAARNIKRDYPRARFLLLGPLGVANPSAIPAETVMEWEREGVVEYLGVADDVRPYLANADCVVLPSYREGTPRSVLEASASAVPVITTDTVGCRDTVDNGVSGFLCRPRDVQDLEAKMRTMCQLSPDERRVMGAAGRKKMEREYDEKIVINTYLSAVAELEDKLQLKCC